jgi:hypothetical protein
LAFPVHPLRPLPVTGWVPEDYGSLAHRRTNTLGVNPRLLASSSETPLDGGTPRTLPKQDVGPASLGVRPLAPLHRLTDRVSTPPDLTRPEGLAEAWPHAKRRSVLPRQLPKQLPEHACVGPTEACPGGKRCHPLATFRPRGFTPPRRLTPLCRLQAYCILLPILGFTRVSFGAPPRADRPPK